MRISVSRSVGDSQYEAMTVRKIVRSQVSRLTC
jgi:hypothetical protein